jgi:hypothetical protein
MTKNNLLKIFMPVGILLAFSSMASATVVPPNTAGTPISTVTVPGGGAFVASTLGNTITTTVGSDTLTVTYSEWVYQEAGGTLDFIIQGTNTGAAGQDIIDRVTTGSFAGGSTTTDVGFNSSVPILAAIVGGVNPVNGSRSLSGATVGFDFAANEIPVGGKTDYLIIKTNATQWVPGSVSFQDGVTASGPGFGVAPEPNMACLLSVFAISIVGIAYRRKKNVAKNTEA